MRATILHCSSGNGHYQSSSLPDVLAKGGPPLGMFHRSQYQCGQILLQEGDVLVIYTDGITDAVNRELAQFGEERLRESVGESLSLSAAEICQRIRERL